MKRRPTRTTNRLHFTDLDPTRFEDLCLALIYPLYPWVEIQHYGRLGSDGGVDIFAQEQLDDESVRRWYVQCRRYSRATRATLERAVDDALAKASEVPHVLLIVVACDVRRDAYEEYKKYALGKGVSVPMLWTASLLEARLYAERKDLLFSYFGISAAQKARTEEVSIRRNLAIKRRVTKEFLKKNPSFDDVEGRPWGKFEYSEAIIHSVDDESYPNVDQQSAGISGWFKSEFCDLYHNGIEFLMRVQTVCGGLAGALGYCAIR
jgi:restriction endonuclease